MSGVSWSPVAGMEDRLGKVVWLNRKVALVFVYNYKHWDQSNAVPREGDHVVAGGGVGGGVVGQAVGVLDLDPLLALGVDEGVEVAQVGQRQQPGDGGRAAPRSVLQDLADQQRARHPDTQPQRRAGQRSAVLVGQQLVRGQQPRGGRARLCTKYIVTGENIFNHFSTYPPDPEVGTVKAGEFGGGQ